MESETTNDVAPVVSGEVTHVNFCGDCRHAGYRPGLERTCLRASLTDNEGNPTYLYPTCAEERRPGGRCANGQFFSARRAYTSPPVVRYEFPPLPPIVLRRPLPKYEYEQQPIWSRNERQRREKEAHEVTVTETTVAIVTVVFVSLLVYLAVVHWAAGP